MRYRFIATLAVFAAVLAPVAKAEDAPKDVKGLYLSRTAAGTRRLDNNRWRGRLAY